MVGRNASGRKLSLAGLLLALAPALAGQTPDAQAGERLFTGGVRFANGGPPCASCHDVAGLPFPGGGTLGPDLTGTFTKYGPQAIQPVLTTLYFPTMVAVFAARPMTATEQADVTAFFRTAAGRPHTDAATAELLALAAGGTVLLLLVAGLSWRRRIRSVRLDLLEKLGRAEGGKETRR